MSVICALCIYIYIYVYIYIYIYICTGDKAMCVCVKFCDAPKKKITLRWWQTLILWKLLVYLLRPISTLVQTLVCRLFSAKPLSEPMLAYCWKQISWRLESKYNTFHLKSGCENAVCKMVSICLGFNSCVLAHSWCGPDIIEALTRHNFAVVMRGPFIGLTWENLSPWRWSKGYAQIRIMGMYLNANNFACNISFFPTTPRTSFTNTFELYSQHGQGIICPCKMWAEIAYPFPNFKGATFISINLKGAHTEEIWAKINKITISCEVLLLNL